MVACDNESCEREWVSDIASDLSFFDIDYSLSST
jgi:hypothetical protein